MKFTNALSKLTRNGWKTEKRDPTLAKATKDDCYIFLHLNSGSDEVEEVRYGKDGRAAKVALNLTAAMKLLGDIPTRKYDSESQDSKIPTPANICRQFLDFDTNIRPLSAFPARYLKSLKIVTKAQVDSLFESVFQQELALRKRFSYAQTKNKNNILQKRELMWAALVNLFQTENPDLAPLRMVTISTKVPGFDEFEHSYGRPGPAVKQTVAGIFSNSPADACRTVKLMLGEFAKVSGGEIVAIGPHDEAFNAFQKTYADSAQEHEINNLKKAKNELKRAEEALDAAKRLIDMQEKKIEIAQFIDSIAMLSSLNSSNHLESGNFQDQY